MRQIASLVLDKLSVIFICHSEFDCRTFKWKELSCKNRFLHWIECISLVMSLDGVSRGRVLEKEQEYDLFF